MEIGLQIAGPSGELFIGADALFRLLALLEDSLRLFGVLPEVRLGGLLF
jgi:hypothetical protein